MKIRRRGTSEGVEDANPSGPVDRPTVGSYTRRDLVRDLTKLQEDEVLEIPMFSKQADAERVVRHIEELVAQALESGRRVDLSGTLRLEPAVRAARMGRNPRTGEPVPIPAKRYVKVKVLRQLADRVAAS